MVEQGLPPSRARGRIHLARAGLADEMGEVARRLDRLSLRELLHRQLPVLRRLLADEHRTTEQVCGDHSSGIRVVELARILA